MSSYFSTKLPKYGNFPNFTKSFLESHITRPSAPHPRLFSRAGVAEGIPAYSVGQA